MKILNFGSLNFDYVYSVPHFVRPGETIPSSGMQTFCGGKGLNQSIAAAKAGAKVYHAGKVGKDSRPLLDCLNEAGADTRFVFQDDAQRTGHTVIQVDTTGQNCIILYGGTNMQITSSEIDQALVEFSAGDILLLQNEINRIPEIMEKAHKAGLQIALNPSPIREDLLQYPLHYVKWFLLNEIEGAEITGETEPEAIADVLLSRYPESAVVLTLGKKGVYYKDKSVTAQHGIYKVDRKDTTGAGDTFTGYFLAGIAARLDIAENLRQASIASSIAVSRHGAASSIPTQAEVLHSTLKLQEE